MNRLRSEHGYTLVEIMIAMSLMSVGVASTLRVFGTSDRTSQAAQRDNVATQKAQAAIDLLGTMPYSQLGLTSVPMSSSDPLNPGHRVSAGAFNVKQGLTENFVLSSDPGQATAAVSPAAESFTVGDGNSAITGEIYRYITWRDENCPVGLCDGATNTKRITVAVTVNGNGTIPRGAPVWVSKIISDPQALPPGATGPSTPPGSTISAQDFYLYDARCGDTARHEVTESHDTHNTAQTDASASNTSFCENSNSALQPDLMGVDLPDGTSATPLYKLSGDLSGDYDGGLAMQRHGSSCPTTYPADGTNPNGTNKWSIHAWSTNQMQSAYALAGQVTLSLYTATVGGASGAGAVCATLLDRSVSNGVPIDVSLGSFVYSIDSWPTTVRRISFTFNLGTAATLPAHHRLGLVLGVRGTSDNDLYFLYDHPSYPSFLEVATPTPL